MTIIVNCSIYQSHRVGVMFGKLLYKDLPQARELLSLIDYNGCPHDGGEHSFKCEGPKEDIVAFLNLVWESYRSFNKTPSQLAEYDQLKEFVDEIANNTTNKRTYWFRQFVNKNYPVGAEVGLNDLIYKIGNM